MPEEREVAFATGVRQHEAEPALQTRAEAGLSQLPYPQAPRGFVVDPNDVQERRYYQTPDAPHFSRLTTHRERQTEVYTSEEPSEGPEGLEEPVQGASTKQQKLRPATQTPQGDQAQESPVSGMFVAHHCYWSSHLLSPMEINGAY